MHSVGSSLIEWMDRQYQLSATAMLQSISPIHLIKERFVFGQIIKPAKGSVLASPVIASYDPDPDYFFHWLRDSAIVMDAVGTLIEDGTYGPDVLDHVKDFVRFSVALAELDGSIVLAPRAVDPGFQQYLRSGPELGEVVGDAVLGEARVNPDGTLDITKWARPQHDGPALRALTVMRLWRSRVFDGGEVRDAARKLVEADLAFTHRYWSEPSFDIWEEELGHHYYTRLVQHAALRDGAKWMDESGDAGRSQSYHATSQEIIQHLDRHWTAARGFYLSRIGAMIESQEKELDIATILAVVHARRQEGPHSVLDPRAQATLSRLEELFTNNYPINASLPLDRGAAMGRYAGDHYYSGGAYYFSTLGAAEFFYRWAGASASQTFDMLRDGFSWLGIGVGAAQTLDQVDIFEALMRKGDGFMAAVRAYTPASGELSEQFDHKTGRQTSAKNLAWSHAALITAVASRRAARRARTAVR